MKRAPFSPVDGNRKRKASKKPKNPFHNGSTASLQSHSALSSLVDDTEYDFLTNPREDPLAITALVPAPPRPFQMSSSKTPKVTNCTEPEKARIATLNAQRREAAKVVAQPKQQGGVAKKAQAQSKKAAAAKKAAGRGSKQDADPSKLYLPSGAMEQAHPREKTRRRRRKRAKGICVGSLEQGDDYSVASVATATSALRTIFEEAEEEQGNGSPANDIKTSERPQVGSSSIGNANILEQKPRQFAFSELASPPSEDAAAAKSSHLPLEIMRTADGGSGKQSGSESKHERTEPPKIASNTETAVEAHEQDSGSILTTDGSDMDESSDDDLLGLTLSPPKQTKCDDGEMETCNQLEVSNTLFNKPAPARTPPSADSTATVCKKSDSPMVDGVARAVENDTKTLQPKKKQEEQNAKDNAAKAAVRKHQTPRANAVVDAHTKATAKTTNVGLPSAQSVRALSTSQSAARKERVRPDTRESSVVLVPSFNANALSSQQRYPVGYPVPPRPTQGAVGSYQSSSMEESGGDLHTKAKSVKFSVYSNTKHQLVPTPDCKHRTHETNEELYTQASVSKYAQSMSYQPENVQVWNAMMAKPEQQPDRLDQSPIGLLVQTAAEMEKDEKSVDGSVLTQDEFFLVDQKQYHRSSKKGKLPYQLTQTDLFKEVRRNPSPPSSSETLVDKQTIVGNATAPMLFQQQQPILFKPPRSPYSSQGSCVHRHSEINNDLLKASSALRAASDYRVATPILPQRNDHVNIPVNSNTNLQLQKMHGVRVLGTGPDSTDQVTGGRKPRGQVLKTPTSVLKNSLSTNAKKKEQQSGSLSERSSVASPARVASTRDQIEEMIGDAFTPAIDTTPSTLTKEHSLGSHAASWAGSGNNGPLAASVRSVRADTAARQSTPALFASKASLSPEQSYIESGILSSKRYVGTSSRTATLWTAECAGSKYKAFGVNAAPVFKLADGRYFQHPPLPPGWTMAVSRSKNIPFYIHPDFGVTFYSPVPLPSADGKISGTTLLFQADTPALSIGTFSRASENKTPAVCGFPSSEQFNRTTSDAGPPVAITLNKKTPIGALAVTAYAAYSGSEKNAGPVLSLNATGSAVPDTAKEDAEALPKAMLDVAAKEPVGPSNMEEEADLHPTSTLGFANRAESTGPSNMGLPSKTTPVGALAVTAYAAYSGPVKGSQSLLCLTASEPTGPDKRPEDTDALSKRSSIAASGSGDAFSEASTFGLDGGTFTSDHLSPTKAAELLAAVAHEREELSDVPFVVEIVNKPANVSEDTKFQMNLDATLSVQPEDGNTSDSDQSSEETESESSSTTVHSTTHLIEVGTCHSSLKRDPASELAKFCFKSTPNEIAASRAFQKPFTEVDSGGGNVATSLDRSDDEASPGKPFSGDEDSGVDKSGVHDQHVHDTPRDKAGVASLLDKQVTTDGKRSPFNDFPEADGFEVGYGDSPDQSDDEDSASLPAKVVFATDSGDDEMSYLPNTPSHSQDFRRAKISTRFKPTAMPRATPHEGAVSTLEGARKGSGNESSHGGSVSSRSYASILSSLSRVSHRSLHPAMPLCSLQHIDKLPIKEKSAKKKNTKNTAKKKLTKNKPKKKSRSRHVPVSS